MASKRKTKKKIRSKPLGLLWLDHIKFWILDSVDLSNNYRNLSRGMADFGLSELSKATKISKEKLKKHIIFNEL